MCSNERVEARGRHWYIFCETNIRDSELLLGILPARPISRHLMYILFIPRLSFPQLLAQPIHWCKNAVELVDSTGNIC